MTAGPFDTESQALALPAVQAILNAPAASLRRGGMDVRNLQMLETACVEAGTELGGYDRRVLAWLAMYEPQSCAAIAGIIGRAFEAGKRKGES